MKGQQLPISALLCNEWKLGEWKVSLSGRRRGSLPWHRGFPWQVRRAPPPSPAVNQGNISISQTHLACKRLFPGSSHSPASFEVQMCSHRTQSDNAYLHIYKVSCKISYQLLLLYIGLSKHLVGPALYCTAPSRNPDISRNVISM